jgi:hypothetical protein
VKDEVNPAVNMTLHAKAEQAALVAYLAASRETPRKRMQLMDRAAKATFRAAGTPRDVADLFGEAVTCLVLERLHHQKSS